MKKRTKKKLKFYQIISASKKKHGAFPFTPEGKQKAEDFIAGLEKNTREKFRIQKV